MSDTNDHWCKWCNIWELWIGSQPGYEPSPDCPRHGDSERRAADALTRQWSDELEAGR